MRIQTTLFLFFISLSVLAQQTEPFKKANAIIIDSEQPDSLLISKVKLSLIKNGFRISYSDETTNIVQTEYKPATKLRMSGNLWDVSVTTWVEDGAVYITGSVREGTDLAAAKEWPLEGRYKKFWPLLEEVADGVAIDGDYKKLYDEL